MLSLRRRHAYSILRSCHDDLPSLCARGDLAKAMSSIELSPPTSENSYIFFLKACVKSKALPVLRRFRNHLASSSGRFSNSLREHLVLALARCGAIDDALSALHSLPHRTVFTWTAIISGLIDSSRASDALSCYQCMLSDGVDPDPYTFVSLFKACGYLRDIECGKLLHAQASSKGFTTDVFVCSALVCMYGNCGSIDDACSVFSNAADHNTVSWVAMASAFIDQGLNEEALLCYRQMIEEGLDPNQAAFVVATQACGMIPYRKGKEKVLLLDIGIGLHTDAQKKNLASDAFVVTTLVSMYGKLGALSNAKHAFKYLAHPTVPSCNSLMAACIENGSIEEALQLYVKVRNLGLNPDEQTYVATLQASSVLAERDGRESEPSSHHVQIVQEIVQALHIDAHKDGFTSNVFAGTTLLSAYGKCWLVSEAENIFVQLPNSNLTTWNAMLCVYADRGEPGKAVHLYRKMLNQDIGVDDATHLSVLQACCEIGSIDLCTEMHFYIICNGSDCNMHLLCSILHAYGSSMSMQEFGSVLNMLAHFDIVLLNAGVTAHGREGDFAATDSLFNQWYLAGFKPDGVTFTILLTACSHAGLVDPGVWYFELMTSHHDLLAESTHLVCMIDLLGRAGSFYKVENILRGIKAHDAIAVWSSLMSACYKHCNYELGTSLFLQASSLWPEDTSTYVLMSNMHSIFVHHENAE